MLPPGLVNVPNMGMRPLPPIIVRPGAVRPGSTRHRQATGLETSMTSFARRTALALLLALAGGGALAQPAPAPRYAVISAVGDTLTVVHQGTSVGSNLDRNERQKLKVKDSPLDDTALGVARKALQERDPAAKVSLFAVSEAQSPFFSGERFTPPADLAAELAKDGVTHVVVISKLRTDSAMQTRDGTQLGTGRVEGLGFYIDYDTEMVNTGSGRHADGFLAAFVSIKASLVDVAQGKVLSSEQVRVSDMVLGVGGDGKAKHPWQAMSPQQKLQALQGLLIEGLGRAVPATLKAL
jgi:hypothetical protein